MPPTLAELDTAHRVEQGKNAKAVADLVLIRFITSIDPTNIAGTAKAWLDFVIEAITSGRTRSYQLALAYSTAVRRIQIPGAQTITLPRPPDPPAQQLVRSLTYTGLRDLAVNLAKIPDEPVVEVADDGSVGAEELERFDRSKKARKQQVETVVRNAGTKAAAAAFRHVENGGRDTIDAVVTSKLAVGYQRITQGLPCAFCLMLASRGPVYSEDSFDESDARFTGPGNHKVHDTCGCSLRPIFVRGEENWTEQARTADDLWRRMLKENPGIGGARARNKYASMARAEGLGDLSRW